MIDETNFREKLIEIRDKYQKKQNEINKILTEYNNLKQIILDVVYLKYNAGEMIFTGRSGKISEHEFLKTVRINDVAGCVQIPDMILRLAEEQIKKIIESVVHDNKLLIENEIKT